MSKTKSVQKIFTIKKDFKLYLVTIISIVVISVIFFLTIKFNTSHGLVQANNVREFKFTKSIEESPIFYPFDSKLPIFNLTISGKVNLLQENSFLRVILVDKNDEEYLVYEIYPLLTELNFININNSCEETCLLNQVFPKSLKIEGYKSAFQLENVSTSDSFEKLNMKINFSLIQTEREKIRAEVEKTKIKKINEQIKSKKRQWLAGETSVSRMFYNQKKKLFYQPDGKPLSQLPNLQGFEYYVGGVFENKTENQSKWITLNNDSNLPKSWDWRNVHGENWLTSVKDQGTCGSCWVFSPIAAIEANINLYSNKHLNFDLSEQDPLACSAGGNCYGGLPGRTLNYAKNTGIVPESCFPYDIFHITSVCQKCSDWQTKTVKIGGYNLITDKNLLKSHLIKKGVISVGIISIAHSMALVGWQTDPVDQKTVWIFKNSFGTWRSDGYVKMKVNPSDFIDLYEVFPPFSISGLNPTTLCVDKDGDRFCNWGISEVKPSTCPDFCQAQKDCDDSNYNLGPFDENFNCQSINRVLTPIPTLSVYPPGPSLIPGKPKIPCDKLSPCQSGFFCKCDSLPKTEITGKGGCSCIKN